MQKLTVLINHKTTEMWVIILLPQAWKHDNDAIDCHRPVLCCNAIIEVQSKILLYINLFSVCEYELKVIFWSKPKIINKQYFGCCSDLDQVITMGNTFTQLPTCSDSTVSCIDFQISWFKATAEQTAILTLETHGLV